MAKRLLVLLAGIAVAWAVRGGTGVSGAAASGDVYQAIRANDLARLKTLITTSADANAADESGQTPLMWAAAVGSAETMTYLLDLGADVNAQNAFGSTPLIWSATDPAKVRLLVARRANVNLASKTGRTPLFVAATSDGSAAIVRQLVAAGADLTAKDAFQNTVLAAAATGNDIDTIRIALDAGIDVNAAGITGLTPLMLSAGYHANLEVTRLLLAKGARVNAVADTPGLFPIEDPKSGRLALHSFTPLLLAMPHASPELVQTLLQAGADINAKDSRNMTPLMFAVATNHQVPAVIRLLLDRGADPTLQSNVGESAIDWARKVGAPRAMELLKVPRAPEAAAAAPTSPAVDVKTAAERGVALLETSSQKFFETSGCVSCHHQNITDMAVAEARSKGLRVDELAAQKRIEMNRSAPPPALLYERMDIGVPEIFASALTALAAVNYPADRATDALVSDIAASQMVDGSWRLTGGIGSRPPAEEGLITRTALSVRALKAYGAPGRGAEMTARIAKAQRWLLSATPLTAEDRNMRALGIYWAGAEAAVMKPLATAILADQQVDGGWRQRDGLASDAYATGQSLYVLAKTGALAPTEAAFQRGIKFLLATQSANGSWRVMSRSPKFQAYFNSGFPYAGDQWISAWATGWATMALAQAVPPAARPKSIDR
jgi:ankyrin repeat protein